MYSRKGSNGEIKRTNIFYRVIESVILSITSFISSITLTGENEIDDTETTEPTIVDSKEFKLTPKNKKVSLEEFISNIKTEFLIDENINIDKFPDIKENIIIKIEMDGFLDSENNLTNDVNERFYKQIIRYIKIDINSDFIDLYEKFLNIDDIDEVVAILYSENRRGGKLNIISIKDLKSNMDELELKFKIKFLHKFKDDLSENKKRRFNKSRELNPEKIKEILKWIYSY